MTSETLPLTFDCQGRQLVGLLHKPRTPRRVGVVIVVGAPQYRIGSHRHFLLLARHLVAAGFPVLRFDYRGMGDSDGDFRDFESVDDDIRAALDTFASLVPEVERIVLWGLCDGAAALAFYAPQDERVCGTVIINPWVRTDRTLAQQQISGHYRNKLTDRDFWLRLLSGKINPFRAAAGLFGALAKSAGTRVDATDSAPLPDRVAAALRDFPRPTLLVLSGQDGTAQEFDTAVLKSPAMADWTQRPDVAIKRLEPANHTYSRETWRQQIHDWTAEWLNRF